MPRESVPLDDVIRSMMNHVITKGYYKNVISQGNENTNGNIEIITGLIS